jgi:dTDP-4-dehydrorhamnose 3,5-epimerase-like enzyme
LIVHAFSGIIPSPVLGIPTWVFRATNQYEDPRGAFAIPVELPLLEPALRDAGWPLQGPLRQLNVSVSKAALTARGAHVSSAGKLCFVLAGSFSCAVVDLRLPRHDTFGVVEHIYNDYISGMAFYVPPGYGNCLMSLAPGSMYVYALDADFDPAAEQVVSMDTIDIRWPQVPQLISAKDRAGLTLEEYIAQSR